MKDIIINILDKFHVEFGIFILIIGVFLLLVTIHNTIIVKNPYNEQVALVNEGRAYWKIVDGHPIFTPIKNEK